MIQTLTIFFNMIFKFFEYAILLEVILSWLFLGKENKFTNLVHIFTEPFMNLGRRINNIIIPKGFLLDFSPIFALGILYIVRYIVFYVLGLF